MEALAATPSKISPRYDQQSPIPDRIQYDIHLNNPLRRLWHITSDPALKFEVNSLLSSVIRQLNEWRNGQWSAILESLDPEDQSLCKMAKRVMRFIIPLVTPRGIALSNSEKNEALVDNLEAKFQPVNDPLEPT